MREMNDCAPACDEGPVIRVHLWIEGRRGVFFGMGRAMLLRKILEYGSLKRAAEEIGMSYRAAWGKIKRTEHILGYPLIRQVGSKRGGYQVTEEGRALLESFLAWYEDVEGHALRRALELLPWVVEGYGRGRAADFSATPLEDRAPNGS